MRKIISVFLFVLLVGSLFFADFTCLDEVQAQLISNKLAVPEFTVRYCEYPFDVPAVEIINSYTGETWTIPDHSAVNRTIEIRIKNPRGYSDICYNVRYKGHYGTSDESWTEIFPRAIIGGGLQGGGFPMQSNSEYTTLSFPHGACPPYIGEGIGYSGGLPFFSDSILDLQVEAIAFTIKESWPIVSPVPLQYYSVEEISGWSNTKSVTIPAFNLEAPNQIDPTPSPTYTIDQPPQTEVTVAEFNFAESGLVVGLCVVIVVLSIALVYKYRK